MDELRITCTMISLWWMIYALVITTVYIGYDYQSKNGIKYITPNMKQLQPDYHIIIKSSKNNKLSSINFPSINFNTSMKVGARTSLPSAMKSPSTRKRSKGTLLKISNASSDISLINASQMEYMANYNKQHHLTRSNKTKDIYARFRGRFGNIIFEFAAVFSMTLAANCKRMFFINNGQAARLIKFFPKLKSHVKIVRRFPPNLKRIIELDKNKYAKKTTNDIAAARQDVYLDGFLGELKPIYHLT